MISVIEQFPQPLSTVSAESTYISLKNNYTWVDGSL